ncbi:hypothetical protein PIB30_100526 [Stylosanthes scabra]|uniref:Glycine-rich protein n=1 Tax=Stylosanthes scabra TaxID=79078 RepID=A0ABU6XW53_9FABA|nr:hypothetical protein [Stylosanthes scabra]
MSCKALLVLVMFMVTILLTASKEAPRDLDEKFDQNDGNNNDLEHALDESKQYRSGFSGRGGYGGGFGGRGGYHGPRRAGYSGGWDGSSGFCVPPTYCCVWKSSECTRCCLPPQSAPEANT